MTLPIPPPPDINNQPVIDDDNTLTRVYSRWFNSIYSILVQAQYGAPANAQFILQVGNSLIPNAQIIGNLASGFVKVTNGSGILSSTGHTSIQTSDLAITGVTANSYGSTTQSPQFTVGVDGRITSAVNVTISGTVPGGAAGGDLSGNYPNPTVNTISGKTPISIIGSVNPITVRTCGGL